MGAGGGLQGCGKILFHFFIYFGGASSERSSKEKSCKVATVLLTFKISIRSNDAYKSVREPFMEARV